MELSTFGAIVGFAMELERAAESYYQGCADSAHPEVYLALARESKKRCARLEMARREGISEMILEAITGLSNEEYQLDLPLQADPSELLRRACLLEETQARFYRTAAEKLPIKEVQRTFLRLAAENEKRHSELREFQGEDMGTA